MTPPTPGQVAYEARQAARGRRKLAGDTSRGWGELSPGHQADEEAGAQAVLDARTPWGDVNVVVIAMGPKCAVVQSGGTDGDVVKVISYGDTRLAYYDSYDEWKAANAQPVPGDDCPIEAVLADGHRTCTLKRGHDEYHKFAVSVVQEPQPAPELAAALEDFNFERNQVIELRAVVLDMARSIRASMNGGGRIAQSEVIDWTTRAGVEFDIYAEPGGDQ